MALSQVDQDIPSIGQATPTGCRRKSTSFRHFLLSHRGPGSGASHHRWRYLGQRHKPRVDGGKGLLAALPVAYPAVLIQRCWAHYADLQIMPTGVWNPAL